jgi:hypothetical protein
MDFSFILNHPDRDEIISKIMTGTDPKQVSEWLKIKYTDKEQSHLRLSFKVLKDFADSPYLDVYQQTQQDLAVVKNGNKIERQLSSSLINNKTYIERINEAAEEIIELPKMFKNLDVLLRARFEQVFDKIQQNPDLVNGKTDYVLIKYIEQYLSLLEKADKIVNNRPDQIIQHNHTVTYIDQYTAILQEAVRETLAEIDQEASLKFMDKLAEKMKTLQPPENLSSPISSKDLFTETKSLQHNLIAESIEL